MKISIAIASKDRGLTGALLDNPKTLSAGQTKIQLPDGDAALVWEGEEMAKSGIDLPRVAEFSLEFGAAVASGLVANWLWNKIKGKQITSITIDRTSVEFEEGEIKKAVREKITKKIS
jgi:hypothetical protein